MNLTYFRSFLEVIKRGGFSEAAKILGMSQPTVSFQIQRLEVEMGAKLLERQGGRIVMTAAGREFLAFAQRVVLEQAALQERVSALQTDVAGHLSLGASTNPGEHLLPRMVGEFHRLYPKVEVTIAIADTAEIVGRVLEREHDAGLVGAEVRRRGLVVRKVAEDQLLLIASPDHPLVSRKTVLLKELAAEPFVVREEGSGTQKTVQELMSANGLSPQRLKKALVVGSNQAMVTAVEAGVGLAFASRMAAARSLELGRVRALPLDGIDWVRGIYFVHLVHPSQTRLFQEFARFVEGWGARNALATAGQRSL